jgi:hypothetical protein
MSRATTVQVQLLWMRTKVARSATAMIRVYPCQLSKVQLYWQCLRMLANSSMQIQAQQLRTRVKQCTARVLLQSAAAQQ